MRTAAGQILVRQVSIVAVSVAVGAAYIEGCRGLPWLPSADQLRVEAQYRAGLGAVKAAETRDAILAEAAVDLGTFVALAERGALIIDARQQVTEFTAGHVAAPFVIHLPPERALAELHLLEGLVLDGVPIVIYCESETCEDSKVVYRELRQAYGPAGHVYLYAAGWEGPRAGGVSVADGDAAEPESVISECHGEYHLRGGGEAYADLLGAGQRAGHGAAGQGE